MHCGSPHARTCPEPLEFLGAHAAEPRVALVVVADPQAGEAAERQALEERLGVP
jgi:hypothetical protein